MKMSGVGGRIPTGVKSGQACNSLIFSLFTGCICIKSITRSVSAFKHSLATLAPGGDFAFSITNREEVNSTCLLPILGSQQCLPPQSWMPCKYKGRLLASPPILLKEGSLQFSLHQETQPLNPTLFRECVWWSVSLRSFLVPKNLLITGPGQVAQRVRALFQYAGCGFDPGLGHIQQSTNDAQISATTILCLPVFPSLPPPSKINQ